MARLPQSHSTSAPFGPSSSLPPTPPLHPGHGNNGARKNPTMASVEQLVLDICNPVLRENALLLLSKNFLRASSGDDYVWKRRDIFKDLAPILWNSFGTIAAILQEIVSIYPLLSPPILLLGTSNRVCNALALLQCIASHSETRIPFLNAHIPLYLYPFLNSTSKTRPYEFLRLTSLGVIGALVKSDDTAIIIFLLQTEIFPLCLRTMEIGSELSKTVATFIVQRIILDEVGLYYICSKEDRFCCVTYVLGTVVDSLVEQPSMRLLKHIIRCYLRFSEDHRYYACFALRDHLPKKLKDGTFENLIGNDRVTRLWLQRLLFNVYGDIWLGGLQRAFVQ